MSDADQSDSQGKDRSGAESLVQTFVDAGVNVCFANPGTSEMHFVAALDSNPEMRCVLGLFEGVVTGAADGYGRMTGMPAATLTHLGPQDLSTFRYLSHLYVTWALETCRHLT